MSIAVAVTLGWTHDPPRHPSRERQRPPDSVADPGHLGVRIAGPDGPRLTSQPPEPTDRLALEAVAEGGRRPDGEAADLSELGLAQLTLGRFDDAVETLREAARENPADPAAKAGLAAALLARGRALDRPVDVVESLDLIGTAPDDLASRFNRALALDELFLHRLAAGEWDEYLRRDPESEWADLARKRRAALPPPSSSPAETVLPASGPRLEAPPTGIDGAVQPEDLHEWIEEVGLPAWSRAVLAGDDAARLAATEKLREVARRLARSTGEALPADEVEVLGTASAGRRRRLAAALELYERGRRALERYEFERARELLSASGSGLRQAGSPHAWWAEAGVAQCDYQLGRPEARPAAERVLEAARRLGYLTLQLRARWVLTQIALARLDLERALVHADESERVSREAGMQASTAKARLLLARIYDELGAPSLAWSRRMAGLEDLSALGDQETLALTIGYASFALARQGRHGAAADFASEMLAFDRAQGTPLGLAESLWIRASHRARAGDLDGALQDVREAEPYLSEVASPDNRARLLAGLRAVEGSILSARQPELAARKLTEALSSLRERGYEYGQAELLLERARAWRRLGRPGKAAADLDEAATAVEAQRGRIERPLLQVSFFDLQAELADERVATIAALGDATRTFWSADRNKGLLFRERLGQGAREAASSPPLERAPDGLRLSAHDAVVSYWSLPEELLIWVVRRDREPELVRRAVSRRELSEAIASLSRSIVAGGSSGSWARQSAQLYRRLIAPVEDRLTGVDRLILVPDRVTRTAPWPALRATPTAPPLAARYVLRISPAASALLEAAVGDARPLSATSPLLAAGDPRLAGSSLPVPSLPAAREEVRAIARRFVGPEILLGSDATRERFLAALGEAAIVHLATHFVAGKELWSTTVVLADDGGTETPHVQAREIATLRLPRLRLAVLSGCETQWEGRPSVEGTFSVAGAFLAAGAQEVVATSWPVDDRTTSQLMKVFYRELLAGREADEALREAQLALLSEDGGSGPAAGWAAFQLLSLRPPGESL